MQGASKNFKKDKISFKERYELQIFQKNEREKKIEELKRQKEKEAENECTFSPKLTKMGREI